MVYFHHSPPQYAPAAYYVVVAWIPALHACYLLNYDDVKQCDRHRTGIQCSNAHIRYAALITPRCLDMMTFSHFTGHKRADISRIAPEKRRAAMLNTLPRRRIHIRQQYAANSDKCVKDLRRRLVLTGLLGT